MIFRQSNQQHKHWEDGNGGKGAQAGKAETGESKEKDKSEKQLRSDHLQTIFVTKALIKFSSEDIKVFSERLTSLRLRASSFQHFWCDPPPNPFDLPLTLLYGSMYFLTFE